MKRCLICKKNLEEWNKTNLCSYHYNAYLAWKKRGVMSNRGSKYYETYLEVSV